MDNKKLKITKYITKLKKDIQELKKSINVYTDKVIDNLETIQEIRSIKNNTEHKSILILGQLYITMNINKQMLDSFRSQIKDAEFRIFTLEML